MTRIWAIGLVVVAIVGGGIAGYATTRGDDDTAEPSKETPTSASTATPGTEQSRIIDLGVTVDDPATVDRLIGTTGEFRALVADSLNALTADCPTRAIAVDRYSTAGFAMGSVSNCGGYVAIWAVRGGKWTEIIGTQAAIACDKLERFAVPAKLLDDPRCMDAASHELVLYKEEKS